MRTNRSVRVVSADTTNTAKLLIPLLTGAAVTVTLGVYARLHQPTGIAVNIAGFSSPQTVKVWLTTASATFAIAQLLTALAMYGKLPTITTPPWAPTAHRICGRLAFLLAVPVAAHCLYALGYQTYNPRVLAHSTLGCIFFGAFTIKMLTLTKRGIAGWILPLTGGIVFTTLTLLWLTSSLWFFTTTGIHF